MAAKKLFSIGGVPVHLDPSFVVIVGILGIQIGLPFAELARNVGIWIVVVGIAVLIHELGHAAAFVIFGRHPSVQLYGFGGLTSAEGDELSPARSLVVAVAGPLAGFGLGGLDLLLFHPTGELGQVVNVRILVATFLFGVFNLLPVLPLDGGQTMRSILRAIDQSTAERRSRVVSIGVAAIGALVGLRVGYTYAALLGLLFAGQNLADLRRLKDEPVRDRLRVGYEALAVGRFDVAAQVAEEVVEGASGGLRSRAIELRAWSHLGIGDVAGARQALALRPPRTLAAPGAPASEPELMLEACMAALEGGGPEAFAVVARALADGEWAPPKVLVDLLAAPGAMAVIVANLATAGPDGGPSLAGLDRLQALAHLGGAWAAAAAIGHRRFELRPDGVVAVNIACSAVRAGRVDEAISWLQRALDVGLADPSLLDTDPDLAPLRTTPAFFALRSRAPR